MKTEMADNDKQNLIEIGTEKLAEKIEDWGSFPEHTKYKEALRAKHARKSSFWENILRQMAEY